MSVSAAPNPLPDESYPGERLCLPQTGRGSLARWTLRLAAFLLDWAASSLVAIALFGTGVIHAGDTWRTWMTMSIYFVEVVVLTALTSGSFGQLLCRLAVVRLGGGQPVGWARSIGRTVGVCLVIPALVIGANRRGLHDLALGTIVINRR